MASEKPKYRSIEKSGDFELRLYAPMIVAETYVEGSFDRASTAGFRPITGCIFGDIRAHAGAPEERFAMTAPVTMETGSRKIDMFSDTTRFSLSVCDFTDLPTL